MVKNFSQTDQKRSDGLLGGLLYRLAYGIRPIGPASEWKPTCQSFGETPEGSRTGCLLLVRQFGSQVGASSKARRSRADRTTDRMQGARRPLEGGVR
jgi:hypothetical protein